MHTRLLRCFAFRFILSLRVKYPLTKLDYLRSIFSSRVILSQDWLPTVQLVLQADWQVLLHSPQAVTFLSAGFAIVLIIRTSSLYNWNLCTYYNTLFSKLQAFTAFFLQFSRQEFSFLCFFQIHRQSSPDSTNQKGKRKLGKNQPA